MYYILKRKSFRNTLEFTGCLKKFSFLPLVVHGMDKNFKLRKNTIPHE